MGNMQVIINELLENPVYIVFILVAVFLLLVVIVLGWFLVQQKRMLARLESQMKGFNPEATSVITNQRLSAVFDQAGAPTAPGMGVPPGPEAAQPPIGTAQGTPAGLQQAVQASWGEAPQAAPSAPVAPQPPASQPSGVNVQLPQAGVLTQYQEGTGEGIEEIEKKLAEDPNNPDLLDWLAFMYYSNNQIDKAIEMYQRALNLNYENEHQHYYLGNSFYKQGNIERAIEEWEVVISLKPNSKIAQNAQERINKARQLLAQQGG